MIRQNVRGSALVAVAAILWGSVGVVAAALQHDAPISVLWLGALRLWLAMPFMWLWQWWSASSSRALWRHPKHRWWMLAGGIAFAGYQVAYFAAIPYVGVAAAVMLNLCSAPLFAVGLARVVWGERLAKMAWLGLLTALCGAALLVMGPTTVSLHSWWGVALALGAGLCYSVVALASQAVSTTYPTATVVSTLFAVAGVCLAIVVGVYAPYGWPQWSASIVWGVAYLALVPTTISYLLYVRGLRVIRATTATTVSLLEPLTSVLLAVILLGERLAWQSWLGAGVLLVGTAVLVWSPPPSQTEYANGTDDAKNTREHGQA